MLASIFLAGVALLSAATSQAATCWKDTQCSGPLKQAFPGPWDKYNLSPKKRTVEPVRVLDSDDNEVSKWPSKVSLKGNGTMRVFDFGKEVGGIISLTAKVRGAGRIGLAFTESLNFTGYVSDDSDNYDDPNAYDGAIFTPDWTADSSINYTMPYELQRGGFRYLTLYTIGANASDAATVEADLKKIELEIAFEPTWSNLQAYKGYFHSSDDLLNRIWYAGAYTLQTDMIPADALRDVIAKGWLEDLSVGLDMATYPTAFVDGAKRDRTVWSGDLGLATRSVMVSTGEPLGIKTDFETLWEHQSTEGEIPFAGPPLNIYGSDAYHMAVLVGFHDYILYSADLDYLTSKWENYTAAVKFITNKIDATGMANINGTQAWGRTADCSGHTTDGNMILYRTLITASAMATWQQDASLAATWSTQAESVKAAINAQNFDASVGAFINSDNGATVYPADGNSMALYFNGSSTAHAMDVSDYLKTLWGPIGAVNPELPDNIVPYIEGFEIKGHFTIGETQRALDLIRLSWGWYLNNPYGTESSFIEGYRTDGSWKYRGGASVGAYLFDGAFTSHSHGWSTGPTDALTSFIVGLQPTSPGGQDWSLSPQFGDLTFAEAGFSTPLGKFSAGWKIGCHKVRVTISVPDNTTGTVTMPSSVQMNGTTSPAGTPIVKTVSSSGVTTHSFAVAGGEYSFDFKMST